MASGGDLVYHHAVVRYGLTRYTYIPGICTFIRKNSRRYPLVSILISITPEIRFDYPALDLKRPLAGDIDGLIQVRSLLIIIRFSVITKEEGQFRLFWISGIFVAKARADTSRV